MLMQLCLSYLHGLSLLCVNILTAKPDGNVVSFVGMLFYRYHVYYLSHTC